jgi:hypothetical protein
VQLCLALILHFNFYVKTSIADYLQEEQGLQAIFTTQEIQQIG